MAKPKSPVLVTQGHLLVFGFQEMQFQVQRSFNFRFLGSKVFLGVPRLQAKS